MINALTVTARMATSGNPLEKNAERRRRVLLGPLPTEFLQPTGDSNVSAEQREAADRQAALALQQQFCGATPLPVAPPGLTGKLSITIAQAKLVKNYGMTRMDPYVRLRVGHCIYETHTDPNGGKTPRWNKVIHCLLPPGVTSVYLEIFDECSFTMDELIAWTQINIPPQVVQGETHEDWYPLSGKQGEGVEGMINLVLSYSLAPAPLSSYPANVMMVPSTGQLSYNAVPMYPTPVHASVTYPAAAHPAAAQQPMPRPLSEEEFKQIQEMFPSIDKEVIKSVSEANLGNKDATINSLLQMSE